MTAIAGIHIAAATSPGIIRDADRSHSAPETFREVEQRAHAGAIGLGDLVGESRNVCQSERCVHQSELLHSIGGHFCNSGLMAHAPSGRCRGR